MYYRLVSILIFLKGIFLYFNRSYVSSADLFGSLQIMGESVIVPEYCCPATTRSEVDVELLCWRNLARNVLVVGCLTMSINAIGKAIHVHLCCEELREVDGESARLVGTRLRRSKPPTMVSRGSGANSPCSVLAGELLLR